MKPDKDRVKDLLMNWRQWARDCEPDSAEILYYTISPSFRDYVKPTPKWVRYDSESAEMVEDVLRAMFKPEPKARELIILYWIYMRNERDLAEAVGMSKTTLHDARVRAEKTFADYWELLFTTA